MRIVSEILERVTIGSAQSDANLTLFPLLGGSGRQPDYATLDEAIRGGWLEVGEVSVGGSVPELKVVNSGDRAVLLMDGEELRGAKQNRVLNLTILVPAGQTMIVPVSCVEQGRWATQSAAMQSTKDALYARAKLSKMLSVSRSYRRTSRPTSDQMGLWSEIACKVQDMGVDSPTGAVRDVFESASGRLDDYLGAFNVIEGQTGAMFAIGGSLIGFELFEHPDVLKKLFEKVVRSYALDAFSGDQGGGGLSKQSVEGFLAEVAAGQVQTFPAVGSGEDLRISGPRITGAALADGGHVVHLCAFRTEGDAGSENDDGGRGRSWMLRASDRMRRQN